MIQEQNSVEEKISPMPSGVSGSIPKLDTPAHPEHLTKNIYPYLRHSMLIIIVLITFFTIIFLIHQNGKSLYEHGI